MLNSKRKHGKGEFVIHVIWMYKDVPRADIESGQTLVQTSPFNIIQ
jgi:hypothetical protein